MSARPGRARGVSPYGAMLKSGNRCLKRGLFGWLTIHLGSGILNGVRGNQARKKGNKMAKRVSKKEVADLYTFESKGNHFYQEVDWNLIPEAIKRQVIRYGLKQCFADFAADIKSHKEEEIQAAYDERLALYEAGQWDRTRAGVKTQMDLIEARTILRRKFGYGDSAAKRCKTVADCRREASARGMNEADFDATLTARLAL